MKLKTLFFFFLTCSLLGFSITPFSTPAKPKASTNPQESLAKDVARFNHSTEIRPLRLATSS